MHFITGRKPRRQLLPVLVYPPNQKVIPEALVGDLQLIIKPLHTPNRQHRQRKIPDKNIRE